MAQGCLIASYPSAARLDNVNGLWGSGVDPVDFTIGCRKCGGRRWVRG